MAGLKVRALESEAIERFRKMAARSNEKIAVLSIYAPQTMIKLRSVTG